MSPANSARTDRERAASDFLAPNDAPPWILGRRGAPRRAPENTLAGVRRARELGADGFVCDVRRAADELVVFADARVDRTTDGDGALDERTPVELAALDAGSWFSKRYAGEGVPMLDELLDEWFDGERGPGATNGPGPWLFVADAGTATEVARRLDELHLFAATAPLTAPRVASDEPRVVREAVDAGLSAVYVTHRPDARAWELANEPLVRAVAARAWTGDFADRAWPCERWALECDEPDALLRAMRAGVLGVTTNEIERAVTARRLARLAPDDDGGWPLSAPALPLEPDTDAGGGPWRGAWTVRAALRNPFATRVRVALSLEVRRGAFDVEGLPDAPLELDAGATRAVEFSLSGGSWSPGGDPRLVALFDGVTARDGGPPRVAFDATLARRRHASADAITRRLELLREGPQAAPATMTMRRRGRELHLAVENAAGLVEPHAWALVDGVERFGGRGVRVPLPEDFDRRAGGVDFACGFLGRDPRTGRRALRRFGGGLEWGADPGAPGRLHSHLAR